MSVVTRAIRAARDRGRPALVAYLTAGHPRRQDFVATLRAVAAAADAVEIGVPFSDPMADGATLQRASRDALARGVSLRWLLAELSSAAPIAGAPLLLMSYLNPLLAYGLDSLPEDARRAGIRGLIVPDLPLEESAGLHRSLRGAGIVLVQFVSPTTPDDRAAWLACASGGFLYALTMNGITGREAALPQAALDRLARLRAMSPVPVCAGFGIRHRHQLDRLAPHVDGVIVGSALVEALERGEDAGAWLRDLRPCGTPPA